MLEPNEVATSGTEIPTTTSNLEVVLITFDVLISDGYHLFQQHCQELDGKDFEPDLNRYHNLEKQHALMCMGAYLGDYMVGYSTTVLYRHGHHDTLIASCDSLYVDPNFRRGAGLHLIRQTEKHAQECGVDCMVWSAKPGSSLDLILAARRNCEISETHYRVNFNGQHPG